MPGIGEDAMSMAREAMYKVDTHEKVCAERYEQIVANQNVSVSDREKLRAMISERFKDMYGFLWKIAGAIITTLIGILMTLIVFMLRNG